MSFDSDYISDHQRLYGLVRPTRLGQSPIFSACTIMIGDFRLDDCQDRIDLGSDTQEKATSYKRINAQNPGLKTGYRIYVDLWMSPIHHQAFVPFIFGGPARQRLS